MQKVLRGAEETEAETETTLAARGGGGGGGGGRVRSPAAVPAPGKRPALKPQSFEVTTQGLPSLP